MTEAHDNLKEWYFAPEGRRRARYTLVELRELARDQVLRPGDTVEHSGSGEAFLASDLVDDFSPRAVGAPRRRSPGGKVPGRGCGRILLIVALVMLGLSCLGGLGLGGLGVAVWVLWPDSVPSGPGSSGGDSQAPPARVPWVDEIRAEALQIPTGTSTVVTLDLRDTGRGAPAWEVRWTTTCGAIAPMADGSSARFFAPHKPGWCRVRATLDVSGVPPTTHTLDLLTLEPLAGPALEVQ